MNLEEMTLLFTEQKGNYPQNVKWHHELIGQYINPHTKRSATDILRDFEKSSWITSYLEARFERTNGLKGGGCCLVHFITFESC